MKINNIYLSLPPYISTRWSHVIALHFKHGLLHVSLIDGDIIEIPDLDDELISKIFTAHAAFMEQDSQAEQTKALETQSNSPFGADFPIKLGLTALDEVGSVLQHNPAQSNAPDIPRPVLEKIAAIGKIISVEDPEATPKPEPHCNCMFCQIARAINTNAAELTVDPVEEISFAEEDLQFSEWNIVQTQNKLYTLTNKLDSNEIYHVHLGEPMGCTCGKAHCEHLLAVLKS